MNLTTHSCSMPRFSCAKFYFPTRFHRVARKMHLSYISFISLISEPLALCVYSQKKSCVLPMQSQGERSAFLLGHCDVYYSILTSGAPVRSRNYTWLEMDGWTDGRRRHFTQLKQPRFNVGYFMHVNIQTR